MRAFWKSGQPRCDGCGLHTELCACAEMPRIELDTHILIVQHAKERALTSTTSRLLLAMFANSSRIVYGASDERFAEEELTRDDSEYVLLFPRADSTPIESGSTPWSSGRRKVLVVLDGTWGQCSRMSHRIARVDAMPSVTLPADCTSHWRIRNSHDPTRLCSFESTLRALALIGGVRPELVAAEKSFYDVTARLMFMRAQLRSPETPDDWELFLGEDSTREHRRLRPQPKGSEKEVPSPFGRGLGRGRGVFKLLCEKQDSDR